MRTTTHGPKHGRSVNMESTPRMTRKNGHREKWWRGTRLRPSATLRGARHT